MLNRRAAREDGFTLVELIITIAIMGVVMSALVGIVFQYLRNSNETSTRLTESTDQQFVSAYWQRDVSSLGVHDVPSAGAIPNSQGIWLGSAPGCSPASGTPIVMFKWNDYKNVSATDANVAWSGASQNMATYYTKSAANSNGTSQTQLWRMRCGDNSSDIVLARYLVGDPVVGCFTATNTPTDCAGATPFPATVEMTITVQDRSQSVHDSTGYSNLLLTAERRQG